MVWLLTSLFGYWTATCGVPLEFGTTQVDYFNELANGFLHGQLSVLQLPAKGLIALADPYNPYANAPYVAGLHDLALYHGHLYLTWGPTPVFTLFLPWRLLHIGDMTQNLATLIFCCVGLAFALALLEWLLTTYFDDTPVWKAVAGGLLVGFSSLIAYLLRTPGVYQIAIASAYCFSMIALWCLATGVLHGRYRPWRLGFGSLAIGLAAGSHWDLVLLGGVLPAVVVYLARRGAIVRWGARLRVGAIVLGPAGVLVVVLLAYNVARFGNPLQFGASYQLAGYDPTKTSFYQLGYLWPSLYYYLLAPVRWTFAFPFFALPPPPAYPGGVPPTYVPEVAGGILTTTPLLVLAIPGAFVVRHRVARDLTWAMGVAVAVGLIMMALIAFGVPGASMRYEADFATLFIIPAVLVFVAWRPQRRFARRTLSTVVAIVAVYGTIVGMAISIVGETDQLRLADPAQYGELQRATAFLPTFLTQIVGHPDVVRVIDPDLGYPSDRGDYGTYDPGTAPFTLLLAHEEIDVISPRSGKYEMTALFGLASSAPRGSVIRIYVQSAIGIQQRRYGAGRHGLLIGLNRGLNELEAWVTSTLPQAPGAFPDILTAQDVRFGPPK